MFPFPAQANSEIGGNLDAGTSYNTEGGREGENRKSLFFSLLTSLADFGFVSTASMVTREPTNMSSLADCYSKSTTLL